jgi:hypothetical protein
MKKNYLLLTLLLFLFLGCSEIERADDEVSGISKFKDDNQTSFILPSDDVGGDINDTSSGVSIGDINDTNSTSGIITIDAKNAYKISVRFSDTYNEKGYYSRDEIGELFFDITNIYTNEAVDVDIIENIILEMEEKNSDTNGTYLDFITYTGEQGPIYSIPQKDVKSSDSVALKVKNISGTTNIVLSVKIKDFNDRFILKVPIVIEKNKSSSMAIVPIGSRYDNGLFIDKFVIHVVDSYGNKAIDGTSISTGVINNPKLYTNAYNSALNGFYDDRATFDKDKSLLSLPANSIDPNKDIITSLDTLILLANKDQYKPENLGGWDIKSVDSDKEISLISLDKGDKVENVSYAIGNEYRYDECSQTIMNAAASTFESTDVKDGIAYAELRYVPAMVGKSVFIYANSRLDGKHLGISRRLTLNGLGIAPQTMSCTNENGLRPSCTMAYKMMLNGVDKSVAQNVYIEQPKMAGEPVYAYATASKIDCNGWTTFSIYGIDENKTATVSFGDFISDELIINQK